MGSPEGTEFHYHTYDRRSGKAASDASAFVKYDLDMNKIADLIDSLCEMSKIVNGESKEGVALYIAATVYPLHNHEQFHEGSPLAYYCFGMRQIAYLNTAHDFFLGQPTPPCNA